MNYNNNNSNEAPFLVNCVCGTQMQFGEAESFYKRSWCDECKIRNPIWIYHCPKSRNHQQGYDICLECAIKNDNPDMIDDIVFLVPSAMQHLKLEVGAAVELVQELQKFYYLKNEARDHKRLRLSPSKMIDKIWHLHLMYPLKYYQFCEQHAGGKIIDHSPDNKYDGRHCQRLKNTLKLYRSTFGYEPSDDIWMEQPEARRSAPAC